MKTIRLISTRGQDYGKVLYEFSGEVNDKEIVSRKSVGYYRSEPMGMQGSNFILPQVLALIAMVLAVVSYVI